MDTGRLSPRRSYRHRNFARILHHPHVPKPHLPPGPSEPCRLPRGRCTASLGTVTMTSHGLSIAVLVFAKSVKSEALADSKSDLARRARKSESESSVSLLRSAGPGSKVRNQDLEQVYFAYVRSRACPLYNDDSGSQPGPTGCQCQWHLHPPEGVSAGGHAAGPTGPAARARRPARSP
jgi:hypothetical protein